jgi:hypothetical protein
MEFRLGVMDRGKFSPCSVRTVASRVVVVVSGYQERGDFRWLVEQHNLCVQRAEVCVGAIY